MTLIYTHLSILAILLIANIIFTLTAEKEFLLQSFQSFGIYQTFHLGNGYLIELY